MDYKKLILVTDFKSMWAFVINTRQHNVIVCFCIRPDGNVKQQSLISSHKLNLSSALFFPLPPASLDTPDKPDVPLNTLKLALNSAPHVCLFSTHNIFLPVGLKEIMAALCEIEGG